MAWAFIISLAMAGLPSSIAFRTSSCSLISLALRNPDGLFDLNAYSLEYFFSFVHLSWPYIYKYIGLSGTRAIFNTARTASKAKNESIPKSAFQQITGINIILYYGPYIYKYIGLSGTRAIFNTAISETLGILEFWISLMLIEKWGRRRLSIIGYAGIVLSIVVVIVGILYFNANAFLSAAIFIFVGSTLFLAFFHVGVGGIGWILQGESLPPNFRVTGTGIMAACDWIANGIILYIFPIWKADFGILSFFAFEAVLAVISVLFVFLYLPETKGKTIEQMRKLFGRPMNELRKDIDLSEE